MTNALCSQREFYAAKLYTKLYILIYMCPTQRIYNMYATTSRVKRERKRKFLRIVILTGSWSCRRFFSVSEGVIFRIPDSNRSDSPAMLLVRTCSTNGESWVFPTWGLRAGDIFYICWRYISLRKQRHRLVSCTI